MSIPLRPEFPVVGPVPVNVAFVADGSWFPLHCCGGTFAVVCVDTVTWRVYPVSIPCQLDHSYAVEVYTSWVLYRLKHQLLTSKQVAYATAQCLRAGGTFTDSQSFIQALQSPNELGTGLVDLLLADCMSYSGSFPPPNHLYSHLEGTFLDAVLDEVDEVAKTQALWQPRPVPVGYIEGLQTPRLGFHCDGVHWHDASALQYKKLRQLYTAHHSVGYAPTIASYSYYATCVVSGSLTWGDHLRMVTFRHGLMSTPSVRCAFCTTAITAAHVQSTCRYSRLWSAVLYTHLTRDIRRHIPEWTVAIPTYWGVLVQLGGTYLGFTTELPTEVPASPVLSGSRYLLRAGCYRARLPPCFDTGPLSNRYISCGSHTGRRFCEW